MKVVFHPEFPRDQRKFETDYGEISPALAGRFREEIDGAIAAIKAAPSGAGHFLQTGSVVVPEFRRRNLHAFPFFVLYGLADDRLVIGSVIPSTSDPLTWLARFK